MSFICRNRVLFTQLKIDSGLDENMATLDLNNASHVHVLKFLSLLLIEGFKVITDNFLTKLCGQTMKRTYD